MKSVIEVDGDLGLVRLTLSGVGSFEECSRLISELSAHPGVAPGFCVLADIRALQYAATLSESRALAGDRDRAGGATGPLAIVVGDDLHYGTSSQFGAISELRGRRVGVFRDVVEAEVWLGVRAAGKPGETA